VCETSSIRCNRKEKHIIGRTAAILNLGYTDSCQGLRQLGWGEKLQLYFRKTVTEI